MNKSGAGVWALTLGVVSLLTFFVGLAMGYALFSSGRDPSLDYNAIERVDLSATPPEVDIKPTSMVNPTPEPAEPEVPTPDPVAVAEEPNSTEDFHAARHLFIAVNGQWLADGTKDFLKELKSRHS